MTFSLHDPSAKLSYTIDWTDWMATGDTITSSSWAIDPDDGGSPSSLTDQSFDTDANTATTFVSQLTRNRVYHLTNTITTTQGRIGVKSITIRCDEE